MSRACPPQTQSPGSPRPQRLRAGLAEPVDIILLAYNRLEYLTEMVDALEQPDAMALPADDRRQRVRPGDSQLAA